MKKRAIFCVLKRETYAKKRRIILNLSYLSQMTTTLILEYRIFFCSSVVGSCLNSRSDCFESRALLTTIPCKLPTTQTLYTWYIRCYFSHHHHHHPAAPKKSEREKEENKEPEMKNHRIRAVKSQSVHADKQQIKRQDNCMKFFMCYTHTPWVKAGA